MAEKTAAFAPWYGSLLYDRMWRLAGCSVHELIPDVERKDALQKLKKKTKDLESDKPEDINVYQENAL